MNKNKLCVILLLIAAVLNYVAATINFVSRGFCWIGFYYACLGSVIICFTLFWSAKYKKGKDTKDKEDFEK